MAIPGLIVVAPADYTPVRGRFLDSAPELVIPSQSSYGHAPTANAWMNGVTWQPRPCRPFSTQGGVNICTQANLVDTAYTCIAPISQLPFSVYDTLTRSPLDSTIEDLDMELDERMDRMLSAAFARELIGGTVSGGLSLKSQAHAPNGWPLATAATPIWNALAILENDLGETIVGGRGMIHMPAGLLHEAVARCAVTWTGDHFETPLGHTVIADAGYYLAPAPTAGGTAAGVSESWIYASGPVRWKMAENDAFDGLNPSEFMNIAKNKLIRWEQTFGIVVFDPCPVTAVKTSYIETI